VTREEALAKATEHVNALATNGRGYQDGVRFADKVDAVERLARFLADGPVTDVDHSTGQTIWTFPNS
jgi:outer membrane protein assembly factor BamB